jgi:hypothetical protein
MPGEDGFTLARELLARVKIVLRRAGRECQKPICGVSVVSVGAFPATRQPSDRINPMCFGSNEARS